MEIKNHGVLDGRFREDNYEAGTDRSIGYDTRRSNGDWTPFIPSGEWQASNRGDSMSCVTFSALNSIEMQELYLTGTQINYSDRWIAKMSDTLRQGNYLDKVAATIKEYGLVLEEDYPTPKTFNWDEYHAEIPAAKKAELIEKGKKWKEKWDIGYEWVPLFDGGAEAHLRHAPIQVIIPGHAIVLVKAQGNMAWYFDSYNPYLKQTTMPAFQNYGLKIVIKPKNMAKTNAVLLKQGNTYGLWFPVNHPEALASFMMNVGLDVPRGVNGELDWAKVAAMEGGTIVPKASGDENTEEV